MSWLDRFFNIGGYSTLQIGGTPIAQETTVNFVSGATAVDNPGANRTDVTILGGGAGVLSGAGPPSPIQGVNGEFYIDTTAHTIYGPKTGGAWGSSTSLVGPAGPTGPDGNAPVASATLTFSTTAGNVDGVVYTVPASPSGAHRFVLVMVLVRLGTAVVGSGSVALSLGTTVGGTDIMTAQTVTSSTTVGIVGGEDLSTLGTAMPSANGFSGPLAAGATINARAATTGTLSDGAATFYVYGVFLP